MRENILKKFTGYSNSIVLMIERDQEIIIRKSGDIQRNLKQLKNLRDLKKFNLPKILHEENDYFEMEYIHGIGMQEFLKMYDSNILLEFLFYIINTLSQKVTQKCYIETYTKKLKNTNFTNFYFTCDELIDRLPKILPRSCYHGDLTLENMIYSNSKFYLIDCLTSEYDSWVFDIVKLRQDLKHKWFLRNTQNHSGLDYFLQYIDNAICEKHPEVNNNYLNILMLLRIYPYAIQKKDLQTQNFIISNVNKLWLL